MSEDQARIDELNRELEEARFALGARLRELEEARFARGAHRDTTAWKFVGLEEGDGPYAFSTASDSEIPWILLALLFAAAAVVSLTISAALGRL